MHTSDEMGAKVLGSTIISLGTIAFIIAIVASSRFGKILRTPGKLMDDDGQLVKKCADWSVVSWMFMLVPFLNLIFASIFVNNVNKLQKQILR